MCRNPLIAMTDCNLSSYALHRLREEHLNADVVEADVRTLDLGRRFDLILVPFHSFSEILGVEQRARALAAIRRHLQPSGRLVITLHNPGRQGVSV